MRNEALRLQEAVESCGRKSKVIAVTSGKGGVGKSNVSANLGVCLAGLGKDVLLLDADLSLGNLDIILNINSKYNISHIINGQRRIEEIISKGLAAKLGDCPVVRFEKDGFFKKVAEWFF